MRFLAFWTRLELVNQKISEVFTGVFARFV